MWYWVCNFDYVVRSLNTTQMSKQFSLFVSFSLHVNDLLLITFLNSQIMNGSELISFQQDAIIQSFIENIGYRYSIKKSHAICLSLQFNNILNFIFLYGNNFSWILKFCCGN